LFHGQAIEPNREGMTWGLLHGLTIGGRAANAVDGCGAVAQSGGGRYDQRQHGSGGRVAGRMSPAAGAKARRGFAGTQGSLGGGGTNTGGASRAA
jgi:hypothetical protein